MAFSLLEIHLEHELCRPYNRSGQGEKCSQTALGVVAAIVGAVRISAGCKTGVFRPRCELPSQSRAVLETMEASLD